MNEKIVDDNIEEKSSIDNIEDRSDQTNKKDDIDARSAQSGEHVSGMSDKCKFKKEFQLAGKELSVETGVLARQADASVLVKYGKTSVLCVLSVANEVTEGINFLPLTVNYVAKNYAFCRMRGGYVKREGKLSDQEILITRIIDRTLRPLVADGFFYDLHVTCYLLTHDGENNPDVPSVIGASLLLMMAKVPMKDGSASMLRFILDADKNLIINPDNSMMKDCVFELLLSATNNSVVMIESCAQEIGEERVAEIIESGHIEIRKLNNFICEFIDSYFANLNEDSYIHNIQYDVCDHVKVDPDILQIIQENLYNIFTIKSKREVNFLIKKLTQRIYKEFSEKYNDNTLLIQRHIDSALKEVINHYVLEKSTRIDGRNFDEIRDIDCNINILPEVHGSSLFTRGNTQVMSIATIGSEMDGQNVENINSLNNDSIKELFMIHYNFPPYATGDCYPLRLSPSRREIGHGHLAQKSFYAVLPKKEAFPYTTRIVAEVLESDGSSSIATVCSASIALRSAGVPIAKDVAGIAMGYFHNENNDTILSDISGIEDQCGLMDFKIAGTQDGITAMQMDTKTLNIDSLLIKKILTQSHAGRMQVLDKISACTKNVDTSVNINIPIQSTMVINKNNIKYVIGSGGKNIKEICDITNAKISISPEGNISISASTQQMIDKVKNIINQIITRPNIGEQYTCVVSYIARTGVFVEFLFKRKGLLKTNCIDKYSEGMKIEATLVDINSQGKCYFQANDEKDDSHDGESGRRKKYNNNSSYYTENNRNNRRNDNNDYPYEDKNTKTPRFF